MVTVKYPAPFTSVLVTLSKPILCIGLCAILSSTALNGQEESESLENIVAQLPAEMAANEVDPLTVEKIIPDITAVKMNFKLGWGIFTVAKSTMEINPIKYNERDAIQISAMTSTNSFADAIYRVRNHAISTVSADVSESFEYSAKQEEGDRIRDTVVYFNTEEKTARYVNNKNGENRAPIDILPGTFDPVGLSFFIRCLDIKVGDELVIPTSTGKEFFYTIVRVKKKVKRKFAIGRYEAFVLEPDIKDVGGVFKKSPNGRVRIFLSADDQKLPLRMESQVTVGNFWAELSEVVKQTETDGT